MSHLGDSGEVLLLAPSGRIWGAAKYPTMHRRLSGTDNYPAQGVIKASLVESQPAVHYCVFLILPESFLYVFFPHVLYTD